MPRSPAGPLMHEHRVIERVIDVMRAEVEQLGETGEADPATIDAITDFMRSYADQCHHGKEEQILFKALGEKQLAGEVADAMRTLIDEHAQVRGLTGELAEANVRYRGGDNSAIGDMRQVIDELLQVYPAHVEREDRYFFRTGIAYLSSEEQEQMLVDFREFDQKLIHDKYRDVADALERSVHGENYLEVLAHH